MPGIAHDREVREFAGWVFRTRGWMEGMVGAMEAFLAPEGILGA